MKKAEESNEIKIQVPTCHASSSVCTAYVRGTRFPVVVYHCGTRSPVLRPRWWYQDLTQKSTIQIEKLDAEKKVDSLLESN